MERNRYAQQRRQRNRDPLERRMDQWVETGRQFVDGVAGNRPGQRRKDNNRSGFTKVGRWVEDKMDWFFEEEEEQEWSNMSREFSRESEEGTPSKKKPLSAISLRVPKALTSSISENNQSNNMSSEWPDETSFRVDRWERDSDQVQLIDNETMADDFSIGKSPNSRPLPRSRRRRI